MQQVHALVARSIASPAGAGEMALVTPSINRLRIERDLGEVSEAMDYLRAAGRGGALRINLNGLPDVAHAVQKLRIEGAALEPREIFELIVFWIVRRMRNPLSPRLRKSFLCWAFTAGASATSGRFCAK